jgi:hypothetical protein
MELLAGSLSSDVSTLQSLSELKGYQSCFLRNRACLAYEWRSGVAVMSIDEYVDTDGCFREGLMSEMTLNGSKLLYKEHFPALYSVHLHRSRTRCSSAEHIEDIFGASGNCV